MILKNRLREPEALIAAGMSCLAAGIVAQRFLHPSTDVWQGFAAGLSGVLIGLSTVLNLRGLMMRSKNREHGG